MTKAGNEEPSRRLIRDHLRRTASAYGVLLISLLLTVLAFYYVREDVEARNRLRFAETVESTREDINRRTDAYLDAMFGARALFSASDVVEREEWQRYVSGIRPEINYEGLQALGYAEYVTPAERETFFREEGLPGLRPDLDPGGERPAYFPMTYVAPLNEANENMLGYDFYSDPEHRAIMDLARDTGSQRATSLSYVLTKADPASPADLALLPGFVVYLPVYRGGEIPVAIGERRRELDGFVVGAFRMDKLLEGTASPAEQAIDFEVFDGKDVAPGRLLYDADGVTHATDPSFSPVFSRQNRLYVAGHEWSLYFATLDEFEENNRSNLPAFVLASGVVVSLLLFGITLALARSRTLAEKVSGDLEDVNHKLEEANRELEAFSYSVSHDLRAPLRSLDGFSQILLEDYADVLDEEGKDYLGRVRAASQRMGLLIDDMLALSRVTRIEMRWEHVNLSALAAEIAAELRKSDPEREVHFDIEEGLVTTGDTRLLRVALENLLGNAWKFTGKKPKATIEFRTSTRPDGTLAYFVRDNGAGFEMAYAEKLFGVFQRLHSAEEFEGTGIGLATVQRVVRRHGGRIWAEGETGRGAIFYFTLGSPGRR